MPVRITEADLRQAMRDPRYWQPGHPERAAYAAWVTHGYHALHPRDAAPRSSVWVTAYTRDGHPVAAHWRGAPALRGGHGDAGSGGDAPDIVQAQFLRELLRRFARSPPGGRGSGGSPGPRSVPERQRWLGRDGRDRVDDLRSDPATTRLRDAHSAGTAQYSRPGGSAGRQSDLEALNPVGPPEQLREGVLRYTLADGRIAMVRRASGAASNGELTLEIAVPIAPGRFYATDLFRYSP